MKKLLKVISAVAALAIIASAFVGCGQSAQKRRDYDGTLTYWVHMDGNTQNAGLEDNSEMMLYKEMEKRTGVKINFIHPAGGSTGNEAATTMFLDEELPDIIEYGWESYPGGPEQAIEDGVIIALDDHIDLKTVCPGYWQYVGDDNPENEARKKAVTTNDGKFYGFNILNIGSTKGFAGIFTRKDKLDEWGMKVPETIEDYEALFAKAKAEGFTKPLTSLIGYLSLIKGSSTVGFSTAFDVGSNFYVDDINGKPEVVFTANQPGHVEYVTLLKDWYKKGYIDPDFATVASDQINSNMVNDVSIVSIGYIGSSMGKILPAAKARNANYELVACPFPKNVNTGADSEFQVCYNAATSTANAITYQCGDYEAAAKWCDYVYTEEGMILQLFGIEGEHHTVQEYDFDGDGTPEKHYVYTDLIAKPETSDCNTVAEAMYKYMLPCNFPGYNQHIDYLMGYYQEDCQKDAIKIWNVPASKDGTDADTDKIDTPQEHQLPTLNYTKDESAELNELKTVCESPLEATFVDVVMGKKSIEDYKAAIKTANDNGYAKMLEIYNAAYQRYLAK